MSDEYLFNRRTFLQAAAATTAGLALGPTARAKDGPVKFGEGKMTFTLDDNWGKLPAGMNYGLGCAVVVDGKDRIYVTSRSPNACVVIFDQQGKILETWTKDIKDRIGYDQNQYVATAHGLYWSKEGDAEYLYWTENVAGAKGKEKLGARVYKTDLTGKILYQIGNVDKESATSQKFDFTNPTDVAVAANGDIYVVDGYGSQKVHRFDKNFKHLSVIGGRGKLHGEFNTCHGVWVNTLKKEPELYIADRHNDRIEVFSLDLAYKRTVGGVRNPCCFYQHAGHLYIPDLAARLTVLDENDKVVTHLGDGLEVRKTEKDAGKMSSVLAPAHPELFFTPHALTLDSKGDLYVVEWLANGRARKLKHTPA
jgi:peptidylamidoglycolate lyase